MGLDGPTDDDLTNLNWLQDRNLLTNVTGRAEVRLLSEQNENQSPGPSMGRRMPFVVPPVAYDPRVHVHAKPPYSFSSLIFMAIESSPQKALPVKQVYSWIEHNFPFYRSAPCGWKNTIRHNLSLSKCFRKVDKEKSSESTGKGSLWSVDPSLRTSLLQSVRRSAFHVYPYMSTPRSGPLILSPRVTRVTPVPAPSDVEAVHSMLTLTRANHHVNVHVAGSSLSVDHSYSNVVAANTVSDGTKWSEVKAVEAQHVTHGGVKESYSDGEKTATILDGDDEGMKGAEVLFSFCRRHLSP